MFAGPGQPRVVHGTSDEGGGSGGQAALARVTKGQTGLHPEGDPGPGLSIFGEDLCGHSVERAGGRASPGAKQRTHRDDPAYMRQELGPDGGRAPLGSRGCWGENLAATREMCGQLGSPQPQAVLEAVGEGGLAQERGPRGTKCSPETRPGCLLSTEALVWPDRTHGISTLHPHRSQGPPLPRGAGQSSPAPQLQPGKGAWRASRLVL